ncbi:hypothetical protein GCM10020254_11290 [Streptomyces goshikiensis]
MPRGSFAPCGPNRTPWLLAQEKVTPFIRGSTATEAGSTGTLPSALSSLRTEDSVVGAVLTSVPLSVFLPTSVTFARRPLGAPGAGALAMTSPTTTGFSAAGERPGEGWPAAGPRI